MLLPIEELVTLDNKKFGASDLNTEKSVWVLSYDLERKAITNKKINVKIVNTETDTSLDLYLDHGKKFLSIGGTQVLLINGEYEEIDSLVRYESVMPFCLSSWGNIKGYPAISRSFIRGYEQVFQPWYAKWEFVHRLVLREKLERPIRNTCVCHHIDENRLNNSPENLAEMDKTEHNRLNKKYLISNKSIEDRVEQSKKASNIRWSNREYRDRQSKFMVEENARRSSDIGYRRKLSDNVSIGRVNSRNLRQGLSVEEEKSLYLNVLSENNKFIDAAKFLNMHPNTFRRRLRVHGIIDQKVPKDEIEYITQPDKVEERSEQLIEVMQKFVTIKDAAAYLGIHQQTLSRKLKMYNIWEKLSNMNNHKVSEIKFGGSFSGITAEINSNINIGIKSGIFIK